VPLPKRSPSTPGNSAISQEVPGWRKQKLVAVDFAQRPTPAEALATSLSIFPASDTALTSSYCTIMRRREVGRGRRVPRAMRKPGRMPALAAHLFGNLYTTGRGAVTARPNFAPDWLIM